MLYGNGHRNDNHDQRPSQELTPDENTGAIRRDPEAKIQVQEQ